MDGRIPRVLKVSDGAAATLAGNGTYGFSGDNGPAAAAQLGGDPDDGGPSGIAVDASGNVYIADIYNSCIRKVSNGVITSVACGSAATQLTDPTFIAVDSAGLSPLRPIEQLWVSGRPPPGKVAYGVASPPLPEMVTLASAATMGSAANAQFNQPEGIAIDSAGRMYIADTLNNCVRMIANGVVTTVAGTGSFRASQRR